MSLYSVWPDISPTEQLMKILKLRNTEKYYRKQKKSRTTANVTKGLLQLNMEHSLQSAFLFSKLGQLISFFMCSGMYSVLLCAVHQPFFSSYFPDHHVPMCVSPAVDAGFCQPACSLCLFVCSGPVSYLPYPYLYHACLPLSLVIIIYIKLNTASPRLALIIFIWVLSPIASSLIKHSLFSFLCLLISENPNPPSGLICPGSVVVIFSDSCFHNSMVKMNRNVFLKSLQKNLNSISIKFGEK